MDPETGSHPTTPTAESTVPTELLPPTTSVRRADLPTVLESAEPLKVHLKSETGKTEDAGDDGLATLSKKSGPPLDSVDAVEQWQKTHDRMAAEYWTSLMQHHQYSMMMMMSGGMWNHPMGGYPMPDIAEWQAQMSEYNAANCVDAATASASGFDYSQQQGGKGAGKNKNKGKGKDVPAKQSKSREKNKDKEPTPDHLQTTVMVKNIPDAYDRDRLVKMLNTVFDGKFKTKFDFAYLPFDFKTSKRLGYAFVNFLDHGTADAFMQAFDGFTGQGFAEEDSRKMKNNCKGEVAWGHVHGKAAHIEKYQDSPLMHNDVNPMHKPMIFDHLGNMEKWEPPKKSVNAPRQVQRAQRQHK